jgi:hypothetical protein
LLRATGATINLENQKNGKKGSVVHHSASGDPQLDPIPALARLVHRTAHLPPTTPLGTFGPDPEHLQRASPTDITAAIRLGAIGDNLADAGYSLDRIGSHSLRSGGAINLAMNGYDQVVIMKMGCWILSIVSTISHYNTVLVLSVFPVEFLSTTIVSVLALTLFLIVQFSLGHWGSLLVHGCT